MDRGTAEHSVGLSEIDAFPSLGAITCLSAREPLQLVLVVPLMYLFYSISRNQLLLWFPSVSFFLQSPGRTTSMESTMADICYMSDNSLACCISVQRRSAPRFISIRSPPHVARYTRS